MVNKNFDKDHPKPDEIIKEIIKLKSHKFSTDSETIKAINTILKKEKKALEDYKKGKIQVVAYLIGQVQRVLKGKGNPVFIKETITKLLKKKK